jgi:hypothetical protein
MRHRYLGRGHRRRGPAGPITALVVVLLIAAPSAFGQDRLVAAAGDISCAALPTNGASCQQQATSDLLARRPLDAVLMLGDAQYMVGALPAFQQFYDPTWGRFKAITHPAVGNHEYSSPDAWPYFAYFGPVAGASNRGYYSFDLGDWHLIALNSNCGRVGGCKAGSPQETWLENDLAANRKTCTLAYWHHPRFSSGRAGSSRRTDAFWRVLYAAGADLVLSGHDHDYERFAPQTSRRKRDDAYGIRQFVVGTGGKSMVQFGTVQSNSEVRDNGSFGVLELTLRRASYSWRFVPAAGGTFTDAGSGRCHASPADPLLELSGPRTRLSRAGSLRLFARCSASCLTRARVTVTIGHRRLRSLATERLLYPQLRSKVRIRFSRHSARRIRRALSRRKHLRAEIEAAASAGTSRTGAASLRIRLRR